jgi:hypothetical protein
MANDARIDDAAARALFRDWDGMVGRYAESLLDQAAMTTRGRVPYGSGDTTRIKIAEFRGWGLKKSKLTSSRQPANSDSKRYQQDDGCGDERFTVRIDKPVQAPSDSSREDVELIRKWTRLLSGYYIGQDTAAYCRQNGEKDHADQPKSRHAALPGADEGKSSESDSIYNKRTAPDFRKMFMQNNGKR